MTESIDPAIPLDTNESVEWSGRPRITTILPAVVTAFSSSSPESWSVLLERPCSSSQSFHFGVAIPVWKYFALQGVQYVITDEALYVKRGVLTRSVTQANLETVQNSSFGQGYHGIDLRIRLSYVRNRWWGRPLVPGDRGPSCNPHSSIEQHRTTMVSGGDSRREPGIPGDLSQWQQIRDEIRAIRSSLGEQ